MATTAEAPSMRPSDLMLEANGLDALEQRTPEQQARLDQLKETIDALAADELARQTNRPATPAEDLATAQQPDRPEGAADDEPLSQEQREQSGEWDFEGDEPATPDTEPPPGEQFTTSSTEHTAPTGETTDYTPGQEEPLPGELTAEDAKRLQDAAGITADRAEARSETNPAEPGDPDHASITEPADGNALFDAGPDSHDLAAWQAIVGGEQPTERKITIKGLPSLTLQGAPPVLKKGAELEVRAVVRVTGFSSQDKLKHNLESDELELSDTNEKRTLTVVAATVIGEEDPLEQDLTAIVEAAVRRGMTLRKNANDDTVAEAVKEVIG